MLRMTRKTLLAVEAVLDIALNARPDPVQSKEITRRQGVPQRYLEQVMQHLVHAGVLKGVRGPKGGYTLARERRKITVGEVARIVDALEAREEGDDVFISDLSAEIIRPLWDRAQTAMLAALDDVTIEDLCREADISGVGRETNAPVDFNI